MKKKAFKKNLFMLLDNDIDDMHYNEKMRYIEHLIIKYEIENEKYRDTSNKGSKWTDEELKVILSEAPSKYNCLKYAKIFKRGYGSIEQIYRWANTAKTDMDEVRKTDSFIIQIKKVAKELGFRG